MGRCEAEMCPNTFPLAAVRGSGRLRSCIDQRHLMGSSLSGLEGACGHSKTGQRASCPRPRGSHELVDGAIMSLRDMPYAGDRRGLVEGVEGTCRR